MIKTEPSVTGSCTWMFTDQEVFSCWCFQLLMFSTVNVLSTFDVFNCWWHPNSARNEQNTHWPAKTVYKHKTMHSARANITCVAMATLNHIFSNFSPPWTTTDILDEMNSGDWIGYMISVFEYSIDLSAELFH